MNNEEKILNILGQLTTDVNGMKTDIAGMKTDIAGTKTDIAGMKTDIAGMKTDIAGMNDRLERVEDEVGSANIRLRNIESTVVRIEHEHGAKLDALFDGHKQNAEKLDRIEKEVMRHEEVILRKVR